MRNELLCRCLGMNPSNESDLSLCVVPRDSCSVLLRPSSCVSLLTISRAPRPSLSHHAADHRFQSTANHIIRFNHLGPTDATPAAEMVVDKRGKERRTGHADEV